MAAIGTQRLKSALTQALHDDAVAAQLADACGSTMTTQLTTITPADAEGTPDYAIAAITNSTAYGFASAQEAITVLYVIKNLQVRVAELETILANAGIVTS